MNATPTRPAFAGELEVAAELGIPKAPKTPHFMAGQFGACLDCGGFGVVLERLPGHIVCSRVACRHCGGYGWDPTHVPVETGTL